MTNEESTPQPPTLNVEDLQRKMAELQEQIRLAQEQKETETKIEIEKPVIEGAEELEKIWVEGGDVEAQKQELTTSIEHAEQQLQQFETVIQQAKELGISVDQNEGFMVALQAEKDKLSGLEQKQKELMSRAQDITTNPDVMGKIQEEAIVENEKLEAGKDKRKETFEKEADEKAFEYYDKILDEQKGVGSLDKAKIIEILNPKLEELRSNKQILDYLALKSITRSRRMLAIDLVWAVAVEKDQEIVNYARKEILTSDQNKELDNVLLQWEINDKHDEALELREESETKELEEKNTEELEAMLKDIKLKEEERWQVRDQLIDDKDKLIDSLLSSRDEMSYYEKLEAVRKKEPDKIDQLINRIDYSRKLALDLRRKGETIEKVLTNKK